MEVLVPFGGERQGVKGRLKLASFGSADSVADEGTAEVLEMRQRRGFTPHFRVCLPRFGVALPILRVSVCVLFSKCGQKIQARGGLNSLADKAT